MAIIYRKKKSVCNLQWIPSKMNIYSFTQKYFYAARALIMLIKLKLQILIEKMNRKLHVLIQRIFRVI